MAGAVYLLILIAYLIGSISSAVLFCRLAGLPNPREYGSKNAGATNVLRIGGKLPALGVLLFDVAKGMVPVWLGYYLHLAPLELGFVALAACLGHIFPIFFQFRGGKGVATAFGAIVLMGYPIGALAFGSWLVVLLLFGYSSLAAVVTALLTPCYVWWFKPELTFPVSLVCCLIVYCHHDNIQRLWRGQESKVLRRK